MDKQRLRELAGINEARYQGREWWVVVSLSPHDDLGGASVTGLFASKEEAENWGADLADQIGTMLGQDVVVLKMNVVK